MESCEEEGEAELHARESCQGTARATLERLAVEQFLFLRARGRGADRDRCGGLVKALLGEECPTLCKKQNRKG